jgi:hypothetical protein
MGIKIHSDNMEAPKLEVALKHHDMTPINSKVIEALTEGKAYLDHQSTELDEEDDSAKMQMHTSRNYYVMTVMQVLIIVLLGVYQLFSFRKFLALNHVI